MSLTLSAVYAYRNRALEAIKRLKDAGLKIREVMSPVPDHELLEAVEHETTPVGFVTLFGGISGLVFGFAMATYAHLRYGQIVGGKPVLSIPPFAVVGFEMTVLLGGLLTFIGVFLLSRLPRFKRPDHFDPRVSEDHYMLVVEADEDKAEEARTILRDTGGEVTE